MLLLKIVLTALLVISVGLFTGCNPQPKHPNQINSFDGASYDTLTLAHAALTSLRPSVATTYPQYKTAFNEAAAAYSAAFEAYSVFRVIPADQGSAALAISNLTTSVVYLENTFQADMQVPPATVQQVRGKAARIRAKAQPQISISDILNELEIAASIAAAVPGTEPYAMIAEMVIKATEQAIAAAESSSGQPIDLSTIAPVAPLT
jgi:hypothetical protein